MHRDYCAVVTESDTEKANRPIPDRHATPMNRRHKKKDNGLIVTALVWSIRPVFFCIGFIAGFSWGLLRILLKDR